MWQSEKSLLLEEKVSAVRLTDEVCAGSIKLVIAHASGGILLCDIVLCSAGPCLQLPAASGGILFCAHRKVRKRSAKGEKAFYKDALSPLKSPYPPKSSANPIISIPAQCLLGNTVPIDFKLPTIPQLPAPERSMSGLELRLCPALCLCKTKFLPSRCRRLLCRRQRFLPARSLQTSMEVRTSS